MHLNKLSTSALMRLTILASLDLIVVRAVGNWMTLLHPVFFLSLVTLNLGLYAVMVYAGIINKKLITMMLTGLVSVLVIIAVAGTDASTFDERGPYGQLAMWIEEQVNKAMGNAPTGPVAQTSTRRRPPPGRFVGKTRNVIILPPPAPPTPPPKVFRFQHRLQVGYSVLDAIGLSAILAVGPLARAWHVNKNSRASPTPPPPLDAAAATPL
jgi:hypothetical protein